MTHPDGAEPSIFEFLRARYDEIAAIAVSAGGRTPAGQWHAPAGDAWAGRVEDAKGDTVVYDEGSPTEDQARHIADNDPQFVLDDLDSKRAILNQIELIARRSASHPLDADTALAIDRIACALAAPFAAHPDCQGAWKP